MRLEYNQVPLTEDLSPKSKLNLLSCRNDSKYFFTSSRLKITAASLLISAIVGAIGAIRAPSYVSEKYPPRPEPIQVVQLQLPPVISLDTVGSCTLAINPRGTGCMGPSSDLQSGNFLPDGNHVVASMIFVGAPAAPDPSSIYTGQQLILVKADGTTFPNGDTWKCITCGVPAENMVGSTALDAYPQAFHDSFRVLVGTNIVDCGTSALESEGCTPGKVHIYPIYFANTADGSGPGLAIRELRIHPDNVHLMFNVFVGFGEYVFLGRLELNSAPKTGTPLSARYELTNATGLFNTGNAPPLDVSGTDLIWNRDAIIVGEGRGFTGNGSEVLYIGYPVESCNIDIFAVDLGTGRVRRITSHPEYVDPIDVSPDNKWQVILDTRGSGRMMFLSGMRHVPPLVDFLVMAAVASVRNNGIRRFFQPYLLDAEGDRGTYFGQQINAAGDGSPGSINDPNWNAGADPRWSPDGTKIAYYQMLVVSPACGGKNPLRCPDSLATRRLMVAHLSSRDPIPPQTVPPISDDIPWGTTWVPGVTSFPAFSSPSGTYTLYGNVSGFAKVVFGGISPTTSVAVTYLNYSDDGVNVLNGWENVTSIPVNYTMSHLDWFSDLTSVGDTYSTKVTSTDGFHLEIDMNADLFEANGTLTTTVDGVAYHQPSNEM